MNKRILITSTDLMTVQFLIPHIIYLADQGYHIELACSEVGGRLQEVKDKVSGAAEAIHQVRLVRSPASLTNLKGYQDMKKIIDQGAYDYIWTNEPVMGVVTRLAGRQARKNGCKVIYMVHGFHFFHGASLLNWGIFYPIESFCSRLCDQIVTINQEDYKRASRMHAGSVRYIHGIGINPDRLQKKENQTDIRQELGLGEKDIILLTIGELSKRKNQQIVIRALGRLGNPRIHYLICGKGPLRDELEHLAMRQGVEDQVHFLGYRNDVVDICSQSDIFILSSIHEGLSVASLEAMYCGLPLVISDIRGVRDYIRDGINGYICPLDDCLAFAQAIALLSKAKELRQRIGVRNKRDVIPFTLEQTKKEVEALFHE